MSAPLMGEAIRRSSTRVAVKLQTADPAVPNSQLGCPSTSRANIRHAATRERHRIGRPGTLRNDPAVREALRAGP
jgi:hypothetical protein